MEHGKIFDLETIQDLMDGHNNEKLGCYQYGLEAIQYEKLTSDAIIECNWYATRFTLGAYGSVGQVLK